MTHDISGRFEEIRFVTCPTEEKEPFFWKWSEHGKEVLLAFISSEVEAERERLGAEIVASTAWADGKPEDEDEKWKIHYEGYREARKDILALLSKEKSL